MPLAVDIGGAAGPPLTSEGLGDRFIRIAEVLQVMRKHPPSQGVPTAPDAEQSDDCMILHQQNIQSYRIEGEVAWASHSEILRVFDEWKGQGTHNRPYLHSEVFAPVKVVLAEWDDPIRAALVWGPVYPWQNKLGLLRPGQPLWRAYASVAVLNSKYGQAYYRAFLKSNPPKATKPHGLKAAAVNQIPIARRGHAPAELDRVAELAHQMMALHEAAEECLPRLRGMLRRVNGYSLSFEQLYRDSFEKQFQAVQRRLDDELRRLLGLGETEEQELLELLRLPKSESLQTEMFEPWDMLPPLPPTPPVRILLDEDRSPVEVGGEDVNGKQAEIREALKLLRYWEEIVNSRPPRELETRAVSEAATA